MFDPETETQLPTPSDVDVDWNGLSRLKFGTRFPSSQNDCTDTDRTLAKQSSKSTEIANTVDVEYEQAPSSGISSAKDLVFTRKQSLNSGDDERFPTYVIANEKPAAMRKPSLLKSPVATSDLNQTANRAFHFTPQTRCTPGFQRSSSTVTGVDWGDDNEWIILFDNLLNSTCAPYRKQPNRDIYGNWL
jgi:hypothetical protein